MKKVNYKIWARIIQFCSLLFICMTLLGFGLSVAKDVFNLKTDFSIERVDYGYRNYQNGYPVKARLYLEIPDTVINDAQDTIINQLKGRENYDLSKIALNEQGPYKMDRAVNSISATNKVSIRIKTDNNSHRWFYILYDHLDKFFAALICLWMIKLINSYIQGDFLRARSFNLISRIGYTCIWMNVISFIFLQFSLHIIPSFNLSSIARSSGHLVNPIKISLSSGNEINLTYIFIGITILILADIIRNAIFLKAEQDLTI